MIDKIIKLNKCCNLLLEELGNNLLAYKEIFAFLNDDCSTIDLNMQLKL